MPLKKGEPKHYIDPIPNPEDPEGKPIGEVHRTIRRNKGCPGISVTIFPNIPGLVGPEAEKEKKKGE